MSRQVTFPSHGVTCGATHLPARSDALTGPAGRPCVVMAHGFGGTRDSGLTGCAEGFTDAGMDVFLFDYRGFGDAGGTPRQDVSVRRQRQDYHAALAAGTCPVSTRTGSPCGARRTRAAMSSPSPPRTAASLRRSR
ncbi:alpha/beta hydrolase [Streptomyces griseoluteus]|uniref:alpha/beta hydrolase n=1 Tax=Streptomyces griseoluteus TaxID=29306 RepID=UPI001988FB1E|nr:hypothetical protein [Streptomyces griseoluteus]GHE99067.1 hypothetical protein GCM10017776_14870 [Streptomyces griseoluteus]